MINLLYIDLFCGAGGTSTGVEFARVNGEQCAKVIACVNHDANAIASHAANHPEALHFTEDIRTLELSGLIEHVKKMKRLYPGAKVVLWASLECTNFSKAKGGLPRDADSRTLAEHLFRYIHGLNPDYIQIENVEEFMSWGDLDENGKPISKTKGTQFLSWVEKVKNGYQFPYYNHYTREEIMAMEGQRGLYNYDYRILNAADFGAYTSRKRFFAIFAKHGLPIVWPEATYCKEGKKDLFGALKKWKPVRDVLDLADEGVSIFNRKKPLADKTLERIYAGLVKFVAGGKDSFMIKWNSMSRNGCYNAPGIDEPCPVVSCQNRLGITKVQFLSKQYGGHPESKNIPVSEPAHAVTTVDHHALVGANFLTKYYSGKPEYKCQSIDEPAGAIRTKDCFSLIQTSFLAAYYGTGDNVSSINSPCPTVSTKDRFNYVQPQFLCSYNFNDAGKPINEPSPTILTKDRLSLVSPSFIMNYYSGGGQHSDINNPSPAILANPKQRILSCHYLDMQYGSSRGASIEEPAGTLTSNPKHNLVSCTPWLMNTNFGNVGSSIEEPSQVITANRKWHYLMNPQYNSSGGSIDSPCFTLIARMDKTPPYFISAEQGYYANHNYYGWIPEVIQKQPVYIFKDIDSLCPILWKIINFMVLYQIVDIKMRMLNIPELKRIMGFPDSYVLIGSQADQKKFIGNAVEVNMARVLCEALSLKLSKSKKIAA